MPISKKQSLYLEYLLKFIGFQSEESLLLFSILIIDIFSRTIYEGNTRYTSFDYCFGILKQEIEIKQYNTIQDRASSGTINATDLAAYLFCPASFSIHKSFIIDYPTNKEEIDLGTNYHSLLLAAKKTFSKDIDQSKLSGYELYNSSILSEIKKSQLIYSGHNQRKPFFNQIENFYGDPDYIFINTKDQKFIVEEKFTYKKDPGKLDYGAEMSDYRRAEEISHRWRAKPRNFFTNHTLQLYSYLRNHPDNITFGYLIYWYYDFNGSNMYIHKFAVKEIKLDDQLEDVYQRTKSNIQRFSNGNIVDFDNSKINLNKCIRCSVNKYCGHKTGRFNDLSYPYKKQYLRLYPLVDFPRELIKGNDQNPNNENNNKN